MAKSKKKREFKLWQEFKKFISRGNILDLAVGVVIGTAFTAIVNALVQQILMPIVSLAVPGGLDGLVTVLNPAEAVVTAETATTIKYWGVTYDADVVNVINWGTFINAIINFLLIAIVLFAIVKIVTSVSNARKRLAEKIKEETLKKHPELKEEEPAPAPAPAPAPDIVLLTEIRDLLKEQQKNKVEKK